jgi:hypothetical protein
MGLTDPPHHLPVAADQVDVRQDVPVAARDIRVHIEELALDGFERVNGDQVAAAFRRELARLLRRDVSADGPVAGEAPLAAAADRGYDLISGLTLPARVSTQATSARRLGVELARAVHAGLTRPGQAER